MIFSAWQWPQLEPAVRQDLMARCIRDLSNGGRGIGNQLESVFINPLARALFALDLEGRQQIRVVELRESEEKIVTLRLE